MKHIWVVQYDDGTIYGAYTSKRAMILKLQSLVSNKDVNPDGKMKIVIDEKNAKYTIRNVDKVEGANIEFWVTRLVANI